MKISSGAGQQCLDGVVLRFETFQSFDVLVFAQLTPLGELAKIFVFFPPNVC